MSSWLNRAMGVSGLVLVAMLGPEFPISSQRDSSFFGSAASQELRPLHHRTISLTGETWATQSLTPPRNLAMTMNNPLVGRRVGDLASVPLGTIDYVFIDDGKAVRYAVVALDGRPNTYLPIPMAALLITEKAIQADSPMAEIEMVPTYTLLGLQER